MIASVRVLEFLPDEMKMPGANPGIFNVQLPDDEDPEMVFEDAVTVIEESTQSYVLSAMLLKVEK